MPLCHAGRRYCRRQKKTITTARRFLWSVHLLPDHLRPFVPANGRPNDVHNRRLPPSGNMQRSRATQRAEGVGWDGSRRVVRYIQQASEEQRLGSWEIMQAQHRRKPTSGSTAPRDFVDKTNPTTTKPYAQRNTSRLPAWLNVNSETVFTVVREKICCSPAHPPGLFPRTRLIESALTNGADRARHLGYCFRTISWLVSDLRRRALPKNRATLYDLFFRICPVAGSLHGGASDE